MGVVGGTARCPSSEVEMYGMPSTAHEELSETSMNTSSDSNSLS